jgi:hypothetical protein
MQTIRHQTTLFGPIGSQYDRQTVITRFAWRIRRWPISRVHWACALLCSLLRWSDRAGDRAAAAALRRDRAGRLASRIGRPRHRQCDATRSGLAYQSGGAAHAWRRRSRTSAKRRATKFGTGTDDAVNNTTHTACCNGIAASWRAGWIAVLCVVRTCQHADADFTADWHAWRTAKHGDQAGASRFARWRTGRSKRIRRIWRATSRATIGYVDQDAAIASPGSTPAR